MRLHQLLVPFLLLGAGASAWSAAMPEFGASVAFTRGEEPVTIAGLRGKVAVVLFYQSWCPVCNKWAPGLVKQLEEQYAGQPGYVLIGLKTDGGTVDEAKAFLAGKGADPQRWVVATDADEAYYRRVIPEAPLWGYAVVGPDGARVEAAQAGIYYERPGGNQFVLPAKRKEFDVAFAANRRSALPAGRTYDPALARAVLLAESGRLGSALAAARAAGGIPGKQLEDDLLAAIAATLSEHEAEARDEADPERFAAFVSLRDLAAQLKGLPVAKPAQKAVAELGKDKAIQREQKAEQAWKALLAALDRQPKEKRGEALKANVPGFTKAYAGTWYAKIAEEALTP